MYKRILVALENSDADRTILGHVRDLARLTGAELLLVHVADGWAARHFDELQLRESEEMRADREYLASIEQMLRGEGFTVQSSLERGDPATELIRVSEASGSDLIAMSTHGHRFLADVVKGTTVDRLRHVVKIPVLLLRAQ
ncbi:MAG: universal stress protein [Vicinamibacterales bacterium]